MKSSRSSLHLPCVAAFNVIYRQVYFIRFLWNPRMIQTSTPAKRIIYDHLWWFGIKQGVFVRRTCSLLSWRCVGKLLVSWYLEDVLVSSDSWYLEDLLVSSGSWYLKDVSVRSCSRYLQNVSVRSCSWYLENMLARSWSWYLEDVLVSC